MSDNDYIDTTNITFTLKTKLINPINKNIMCGNITLILDLKQTLIELHMSYNLKRMVISYNKYINPDNFSLFNSYKITSYPISALKSYLLTNLEDIDEKSFSNIKKRLFIDNIEAWFNPSYSDNVFL